MVAVGLEPRPGVLLNHFNAHYWGRSVSFQAVSRWLRGEAIPEQDKLVTLAQLLKTEPDVLRFGEAVRHALRAAGLRVDGVLDLAEAARLVNVFAKAEADPSGYVRRRRHTMLNDSDINNTRHARAVVGAVIASIVGDPMVYVSGGAEHQGPPGGGPVAVIARAG